ncbi:branched-chain amino acid ABC transporter permease [Thermosulfuriphilus sp.]
MIPGLNRHHLGVLGLLIFTLLVPLLVRNDYHLNVLVIVGINGIIVVGLSLLMGYAGQVSLGHAAFYGLGAYTAGILTATYGISPPLAWIAALAFPALVAFVLARTTLRLKGHYLAMATLGFGIIVHVFFKEMIDLTGGPSGLVGIPLFRLFGHEFTRSVEYFLLVWSLLTLICFFSVNLIDSPLGRSLLAIHTSEAAAEAMGVDTMKLKVIVFVLSAVLAALAGILYAHFVTFISPASFGFIFSIKLVTMVVIGGMANLWGALAGAALLTMLPEILVIFEDYDVIVFGLILVLVMIFMPEGLIRGLLSMIRGRSLWPAR